MCGEGKGTSEDVVSRHNEERTKDRIRLTTGVMRRQRGVGWYVRSQVLESLRSNGFLDSV